LGRLTSEKKKKQYYEVIHNEAGRLTYLVNNILDFSKIEANKKTYTMKEADMNQLIQGLLLQYTNTFEEQDVDVEINLSASPLPILVDHQALEVALSNLIENALKFTGEEKVIKVTTGLKKGFVFCEISDNGIGIKNDKLSKVFDKFYRVENALTQQTKGTGLGLSLVKHIVEAHQGQVLVTSKLGQGSTFIIQLPIKSTTDA